MFAEKGYFKILYDSNLISVLWEITSRLFAA